MIDDYSGLQKAAILLITLGPEKASAIFQHLKEGMYFKKMTEDYFKDLIVLSYNEVESNVELQSVGMVTA